MWEVMKEEMAFLKYRLEVVLGWPESPRKKVLLSAIESRIENMHQQRQIPTSAERTAVPNWN